MTWKHLFAKKDLEMLLAEMAGEHRLHRVGERRGLLAVGFALMMA
jgi:hypothetical protein